MKNIYIIILLLFSSVAGAQDSIPPQYSPSMDAKLQVTEAIAKAKKSDKHILMMIGGNWCRWCKMFDKMVITNPTVDSALKANYVFEHINFSKENRNLPLMTELEFPQRFGFPVFVVLDSNGKRLHTQNSAYLEEGEGYNVKRVIEFFEQWGPESLKPDQYAE